MDKCRFDMDARCMTHPWSEAAYIICTRAAQELERRVEEAKKELAETKEQFQQHIMTHAKALSELGSRLARLQEEKAQGEAVLALWHRAFNAPPGINPGDVAATMGSRLTRAEAAAAAMREAAKAHLEHMGKVVHDWRMDWSDFDGRILRSQFEKAAAPLRAALSPDAGR